MKSMKVLKRPAAAPRSLPALLRRADSTDDLVLPGRKGKTKATAPAGSAIATIAF